MPTPITDPRDPRVADFHDLHAGDRRPGTERGTGPVVVEGVTAVERLLTTGLRIRAVYGVAGRLAALDLPAGVPAYEADKWVVSETIGFRLTRGVLASAERPEAPALDDVLAQSRRIAVLEGLNDHENVGSIGRSAVALGIDALLLDPTCADPYYRRSVRVSMGHLLTLPVRVLTDWPGDLERVRAAGFTTVALTPGAEVDLRSLDPVEHPRTALLLGAEGPGLSAAAMAAVDVRARIPMRSGVDSLGVAAAAAVAFAHLR
ncbi:tRNA G18 (ribose-2'-O)-methylase SpoU [Klenkia marina]|uniref:tRNA G18 (Ribose-2'-O)-methylase SpoU n=1 Tax=Klenkia marina TaxID=1960309 RepID=A0A1G4XCL7_9ACTN|nr:RNA methyltransferase [Klenkia marina]SCX38990.1 tRNA G18 (ribose-2'-O)-methylase SpoU [Klenkia marina]